MARKFTRRDGLKFGAATLAWWMSHVPGYLKTSYWLHAKLVLVFLLYGYHGHLAKLTREFAEDRCTRSPRWLRLFNEVPALLLIGIALTGPSIKAPVASSPASVQLLPAQAKTARTNWPRNGADQ